MEHPSGPSARARHPKEPTAAPHHREDARTAAAQSVLMLTHLAVAATDLVQGVTPTLAFLVTHTAATGAAYFQTACAQAQAYQVRATWGEVPQTPDMHRLMTRGLPPRAPLLRALKRSVGPMFFDDVSRQLELHGFSDLGVASLAASPVRGREGELLGAFLMYTSAPHVWQTDEAALFSVVSGTIASLAGRLAADEQAGAAREAALRALGLALEVRDGESKGHTDRVTALALQLASLLNWSPSQLRALRWGAYLHDIGKIAIPDHILLKPGPLDAGEWAVMRSHVGEGVRFASALHFLPDAALRVIQDHHERWNGQGYPLGKAGEAISLEGRLFALCDVYDALTSERPYKAAWTPQEALAEIEVQAGEHFDPELTQAFVRLIRDAGAQAWLS